MSFKFIFACIFPLFRKISAHSVGSPYVTKLIVLWCISSFRIQNISLITLFACLNFNMTNHQSNHHPPIHFYSRVYKRQTRGHSHVMFCKSCYTLEGTQFHSTQTCRLQEKFEGYAELMIIFGKFILISYCCIDMFNIYKHLFNVYAIFTSAA